MNNKFKANLLVIIGLTLFSSCSNDIDVDSFDDTQYQEANLKSFVEVLEDFSQPTEPGSVLIQSNNSSINFGKSDNVYISERAPLEKGQAIRILDGSDAIVPLSQNAKGGTFKSTGGQNIFGNTISYVEKDKAGSSPATTMYVPNVITLGVSTTEARAGSVITWNVDANNDLGVVLYATYHPVDQSDLTLAEQNQNRIVRGIVLPDDSGSYTIKSSDLERFPDNSTVEITVARGASGTATGKGTVSAVTKSSTSIRIDR